VSEKNMPIKIYKKFTLSHRSCVTLRLSAVSFSSIIPQAQSFIGPISYVGFRFTNMYNYILFCYLWHNVEASCHKQDALMLGTLSPVSGNQQTLPVSAINYSTIEMFMTLSHHCQSQILVENQDFCPVRILLQMMWLSDGKNL